MKYTYATEVSLAIVNGRLVVVEAEDIPMGTSPKPGNEGKYLFDILKGNKGVVRDRKTKERMSVEAGTRAIEYLNTKGYELQVAPKTNHEANRRLFFAMLKGENPVTLTMIPYEIIDDLCAGRVTIKGVAQVVLKQTGGGTAQTQAPATTDDDCEIVSTTNVASEATQPLPFEPNLVPEVGE